MMRPRPKFKSEWGWFVYDSMTNAVGTYDPARFFGYVGAMATGVVFLGLSIYDTCVKGSFDYNGFTMGLAGVTATVVGAAGGVMLKNKSEPTDESKIFDDGPNHGRRIGDPERANETPQ